MFISLQSYHHDVWAIQKEIKDAYPKKVCHMPTRHVKKKREKRCIPKEGMPHTHKVCQKREREREREKKKIQPIRKILQGKENSYKRVLIHHPPKISTHLHILIKAYDLFLLWIPSLTQQNMRSKSAFISSIPTDPPKRSHQKQDEKKERRIKRPW